MFGMYFGLIGLALVAIVGLLGGIEWGGKKES
jgi:hypothetical protein